MPLYRIEKVVRSDIYLRNNEIITVSRSRKKQFIDRLAEYWGEDKIHDITGIASEKIVFRQFLFQISHFLCRNIKSSTVWKRLRIYVLVTLLSLLTWAVFDNLFLRTIFVILFLALAFMQMYMGNKWYKRLQIQKTGYWSSSASA